MYEVGDLVLITASYDDSCYYMPPAMIIKKYIGTPAVFQNDQELSRKWMLQEGIGECVVYDILYDGEVEKGVLEEWLHPFD